MRRTACVMRLPGLPRLSLIIDFARAMNRLQAAIAEIEPRDSPAGLRDAGVEVIVGRGQFVDGPTIQADGHRLRFASAIVATGSEPGPPASQRPRMSTRKSGGSEHEEPNRGAAGPTLHDCSRHLQR